MEYYIAKTSIMQNSGIEAKATLIVIDSKYTCIAGEERSKVRRIKDGCANRKEGANRQPYSRI